MRRLVKVQGALSQMVIYNQWGVWKASHLERTQKVKALVLDDSWWARVQFVLDFTEPIMTMLRFTNTNKPCLGDVYDGMDTMVQKVKLVIQTYENDPTECETLCNKVESIIQHHWEKMATPLHLLAYALSLRYYSEEVLVMPDRVTPYADEEVANGCYKAFQRLFQDDEMHKKVRTEFGLFAWGAKLSPIAIKDQNNMGAITWWYLYCQPFKHLQPLAIKVLSQEDHYKEGAAKLWDVAHECTNLDATVQDLTTIIDDDDDDDDNITTHGASSASKTALASKDLELAAFGDDEDFYENPYDSD